MASSVETIAAACLASADGDAGEALKAAVAAALADLCEAERRTRRVERLVSKGYARGRTGEQGAPVLLVRADDALGAG